MTANNQPAWLKLDPEVLARLLAAKPQLHDDDATALVDAGLYAYQAVHVGGRGSVGWLFPRPSLPGAPQWKEHRIGVHLAYWDQVTE